MLLLYILVTLALERELKYEKQKSESQQMEITKLKDIFKKREFEGKNMHTSQIHLCQIISLTGTKVFSGCWT